MVVVLLAAAAAVAGKGQTSRPGTNDSETLADRAVLTNAAQFRALSEGDYRKDRPFHLTGVVTLVDSNRDLLVLQDATGALAVNFDLRGNSVEIGQVLSLTGSNSHPYVVSFPDYPLRPAGREVRASFEAPSDWGEYHLTRMRGYLHPPVTGEYTFWIASDNSSELWLSPDDDPVKARKMAFIPRFEWTLQHEWSKFPSQRSETIRLQAGRVYYIETLQEQTTVGENLAVAWQGPDIKQSVIRGLYLTPWTQSGIGGFAGQTNGILYEYWTNYSAGDLEMLNGVKSFESALTADNVKVSILGQADLPTAKTVPLNRPLPPENNFQWVQVEGVVKFVAVRDDVDFLELSDGESQIQVRTRHLTPETLNRLRNSAITVEGVCEGAHDKSGTLVPGLIWVPSEKFIVRSPTTNLNANSAAQSTKSAPAGPNLAMEGFYNTRGIVTFNDQVFGKDYLFVQADSTAIFVSVKELKDHNFENHLHVGRWVDLGGALRPGRYVPVMDPLVVTELGGSSMPAPVVQSLHVPVADSADGRWMEIEGVVHSVNTNGTLSVRGKDGPVYLWLGQTRSNNLGRYVDAKLRVRGVMSLTILDSPLLLVPSPDFMDVEEEAPRNPFQIRMSSIAEIPADHGDDALVHRVKVRGEIVYQDERTIILQDSSGGIRIQPRGNPALNIGDAVEVIGFPAADSAGRILMESLVRLLQADLSIKPNALDMNDLLSSKQNCTLVQVEATLLAQKSIDGGQLLELQEQQRIFTATLSGNAGALPSIDWGSRVRITGICDDEASLGPYGKLAAGRASAGSLNVLLRSPADVAVLSGPPWWTLKRTIALVAALLTVVAITLLWVHFLRRRLERQRAARVAISRQILRSQESERQRIAINLHDGLGQNLLVIKNQARLAMEPAEDEIARRQRLNKISEITSQAIEEVRQITHDLRPYQLDRLGLTQAVRAVVDQVVENSSIVIACHVDDIDGIFDKESEIHVYRIVQEALNNILKHSAATEAAVVVKNQPGLISLSIRDNGRGFDARTSNTPAVQDRGYGLSGITERVGILGGRCLIDSSPAQGTYVTVEIPKSSNA